MKYGNPLKGVLGAFAAVVAATAIMLPSTAIAEDIVIGIFVPTTGALAPLGTDMLNGYELAAKGATVNGNAIRLVVEDSAAKADVGLRKAQKLVLEDKAKILVGGASSAVVLGINAQGARLNVPILSTNSQAVQTTGEQCSKYLFRTNPNDAMMAKANGILMEERPEYLQKKWFVVFHDFVWGQSNKAEFAKIPGINIVGEAGRPLGTADWSSAISQIQSSGADAIYMALAVGDDMPSFIGQVRSFGIDAFMLPPLGMPDSMLQAVGENAAGMTAGGLFASWMSEDKNPAMKKFVEDYVAAYGIVPGPQAIQAYAGMQLTIEALKQAASLDTDAIISALETTSVDSVIGKLQIRKEDHQGMVGTYMAEATMLPDAPHGAKIGWKVIKDIPWDAIKIDLADTGCKGL
ncbi:ABC transporter substrate-binding protein [Hoeflea sp. G2-23]|uniref:ABC transporter substrate-binding protein n=1 Tax=Hoeflea algicola TaxID=2983763 RepID=A0ABT3ZCX6_9HYPH|nr:ABC transporter substrate-binding protein [Hoeflea algicola]MCY0149627.1 ABC transporter substrate-binding protein [Hoeflea algicola]